MLDVTRILSRIEAGDREASSDLLPLVYEELRRLAKVRMADERADHTLQATALVHEAYVRLVNVDQAQSWDSRGHFFSAAAEAMRRILIEQARRKSSDKRGGKLKRVDLDSVDLAHTVSPDALLQIDEAMARLRELHPRTYEIVQLRYYCGMSIDEAADSLGISSRTACREWNYARAFLAGELFSEELS